MRTIYANEIWLGDKEVVRALVLIDKTIIEDMEILFSKTVQNNIKLLITNEPTKSDGFHFFTRVCQFVVYFQYRPLTGISIELLYFGTSDNVNDTFDYMLKLRKAGWEDNTRDEILELAHKIKKEKHETWFEIAELKVKDPYNDINSYIN